MDDKVDYGSERSWDQYLCYFYWKISLVWFHWAIFNHLSSYFSKNVLDPQSIGLMFFPSDSLKRGYLRSGLFHKWNSDLTSASFSFMDSFFTSSVSYIIIPHFKATSGHTVSTNMSTLKAWEKKRKVTSSSNIWLNCFHGQSLLERLICKSKVSVTHGSVWAKYDYIYYLPAA